MKPKTFITFVPSKLTVSSKVQENWSDFRFDNKYSITLYYKIRYIAV